MINSVEEYLARGWAVVQLHDTGGRTVADGGRCSCPAGSDLEHSQRQGGKHPRHASWQSSYLSTALQGPGALERARAMWSANPCANVGLATGKPSGFWALDVDPDNGGTDSLATLIAAHGNAWQPTRMHVTGSGGTHHLFAMPADFEPTNSRGRLPPGLDVRGTGGQIVAPPSVSGKGGYALGTARLDGAEPMPGPAIGWLLDLIRPAAYEPRTAPEQGGPALSGVGPADAGRGYAYAKAGVGRLCDELAAAPQGTRNETAFRVACRLVELANASWSGVDQFVTYAAYSAAAGQAHAGGPAPFPQGEAHKIWSNAVHHVAGAPAAYPADTGTLGESLPAPPPFALGLNGVPLGLSDPDLRTAPEQGGPALSGVGPADAVASLLAEMLTSSQLDRIPNPVPLVNGVLDLNTTAWLIGKSGSYKSFIALDLAAHVARGDGWAGRQVRRGGVVYIIGEGAGGMKLRKRAWEATHGPIPDDLRFLPRPVLARDAAAWSVLIAACAYLRPAFIVLDTQARMAVGLEENSNSDMMIYVAAADALKCATGACVLSVHHLGRTGTDARGASAIDGAQDTELRVERTGDLRLTLHQDKQKDSGDDASIELELARVEGGMDPETGRDLSSLAVVKRGVRSGLADPILADFGAARSRNLYSILQDHFNPGDGGTRDEIKKMFMDSESMVGLRNAPLDSRSKAWRRAWNDLVDRGLIAKSTGIGQRFKVVILDRMGQDGWLTRNESEYAQDPPDGWMVWQGAPDQR